MKKEENRGVGDQQDEVLAKWNNFFGIIHPTAKLNPSQRRRRLEKKSDFFPKEKDKILERGTDSWRQNF